MTATETWRQKVEHLITKFDVGANFDVDVVLKPEGCKALKVILEDMATKLDQAIAERHDPPPAQRILKAEGLPKVREIWEHTASKNLYQAEGFVFNTLTDTIDVKYSPLYDCQYAEFTRQLDGHAKAWFSHNADGSPRFVKVQDSIRRGSWA